MGISGVNDEPNGKHDFYHGWRFRHRARLKEYESGPTASLAREIMKGFELTAAPDANVLDVAKAIVKIVDMPFGTRPSTYRPRPGRSRDRQWCCRPCRCGTATEHASRGSSQAIVNYSPDSERFVKPELKSDFE